MAKNDPLRRYIDASLALTQITHARAEELVRELVKNGEIERHRAQDRVEDLVKRSRQASEALVTMISAEVTKQITDLGLTDLDAMAARVADLLGRAQDAGRGAAKAAVRAATPGGGGKKPAKKAPAKKAAKKAAPAKAAAKKAAAKKAVD